MTSFLLAPFQFAWQLISGLFGALGFVIILGWGFVATLLFMGGFVIALIEESPEGLILSLAGFVLGGLWLRMVEWLADVLN